MNKKIWIFLAFTLCAGLALTGCKPTEKNYKSAYDAALAKNKAEQTDPDLNLPSGGFQRLGEPEKRELDGITYLYKFQRLNPFESGIELQRYGVAVALYKMPTNCRAQVANLKEEGYEAVGAKSSDGEFYVLLATYPTLEEAVRNSVKYQQTHKDTPFVGLPDSPVILQTRR